MKKIAYSITQFNKRDSFTQSGIGYMSDKDIVIPQISKNGKPYIRVFEDCVKDCHLITGRTDEYSGFYYEIREIEVDTGKDNYETIEIEVNYKIWFKIAD